MLQVRTARTAVPRRSASSKANTASSGAVVSTPTTTGPSAPSPPGRHPERTSTTGRPARETTENPTEPTRWPPTRPRPREPRTSGSDSSATAASTSPGKPSWCSECTSRPGWRTRGSSAASRGIRSLHCLWAAAPVSGSCAMGRGRGSHTCTSRSGSPRSLASPAAHSAAVRLSGEPSRPTVTVRDMAPTSCCRTSPAGSPPASLRRRPVGRDPRGSRYGADRPRGGAQ